MNVAPRARVDDVELPVGAALVRGNKLVHDLLRGPAFAEQRQLIGP